MVGGNVVRAYQRSDRDELATSSDLSATIEQEAAGNLKRTWVNNGRSRDWSGADAPAFLAATTEIRTIWVPYGE